MLISVKSTVVLLILCSIRTSHQDVSHFLTQVPDFNYLHHPFQQYPLIAGQSHIPVSFQAGLPPLYGPSSEAPENQGGYPQAIELSEIATPAPVAAVPTSTEFVLPEIIENRSLKIHRNFIPLQKQYLPPTPSTPQPFLEDRPNYESPQQGNTFNGGYIYEKPITTNFATSRPVDTIVVPDPVINNDPVILPPISNDHIESKPSTASAQGYDYQAPSPPVWGTNTPFSQPPAIPPEAYLPPSKHQEHPAVRNSANATPLRLYVHEMRCMQQEAKTSGFFRAVLRIDNFLSATPSVDNDSTDKRCEVKLQKNYVIIDMAGEDFPLCGVRQCGTDLCLRLRFPLIRGLRTGVDNILTLHCKTQSRVAVKMHALKMGVANDLQARSIGTYAKGGTQNSFRTHVELLRKTPHGYARHLTPNEAVQLGEDLILRAHVFTGDGWNYTKLTDVSLQRIAPSGEILNNVQLITTLGCLNPSMRGICNQMPTFDAPLGYKLPFKAVMFQGMRSGEELIMSMRITGCLQHRDCHVNVEQCNNFNNTNLQRRKREMSKSTAHNNTEVSEISKISFRVIMPEEKSSVENFPQDKFILQSKSIILISSLGFVALLICLGIFIFIKFRKF